MLHDPDYITVQWTLTQTEIYDAAPWLPRWVRETMDREAGYVGATEYVGEWITNWIESQRVTITRAYVTREGAD